ncbi:hypothetical protein STENM223S_09983 [Streptomyces tendae]
MITPKAMKTISSRCGKAAPSSVSSGIASASATEATPRIPAHHMTTVSRQLVGMSSSMSRRACSRWVSQVAGSRYSSRTRTTTTRIAAAQPSSSVQRPEAVRTALCSSSPIRPKATPVTRVSTTSQTVCPPSRVITSSASEAYSARNMAVVRTASTPEPCSSSAAT